MFRELRKLNCPRLSILKVFDDGESEEGVFVSAIDIRLTGLVELHAEQFAEPVELWGCRNDKSWLAKLESTNISKESVTSFRFSTVDDQDSLFKALRRRIGNP